MKLVLKGVSTQIRLEDGTEFHSLDFVAEDGPEGILSLPVPRETVTALMEQLRGEEGPPLDEQGEPVEEPEEEEEEPEPPPQQHAVAPAPRIPLPRAGAPVMPRKRMGQQGPPSDKVPPL